MRHSTRSFAALLVLSLLPAASALGQVKEAFRLQECRDVVRELARSQEGIPGDLLDKAECVAVIPGVFKAAFGFGGRWGYGAVVCRTDGGHGPWGPPLMISLKGGSFGLQIGGQSTDFVFLVMNPKGIDYLLRSQFTLGADVSVAAGPLGRNAEAATDIQMRAEILSYSRSRGLFAGISLEGASVHQDTKASHAIYGERVTPRDLLLKPRQKIPAAGRPLVDELERLSPRPGGW
jgi:SH3 domain-containing YSC84-like protein 1